MPIYEYLCESCGKVNERLQKVSDPPPARCDECGSRKLAKLVSRSAFQLKGGGWYSDLYASPKKAETPSEGGATAAASESGKSEGAKPEKEKKETTAAPAPAPAPAKGDAKPAAPAASSGKGKKRKP